MNSCSAVRAEEELKVRLLGTSNPPPVMNPFGPTILVEAGKEKLLFD
jgi:ribonuclease Z